MFEVQCILIQILLPGEIHHPIPPLPLIIF